MASEVHSSHESAREVFGDTSFFYALLNLRDPNHARALELSDELATDGTGVCTTWDVVVETAALLRYRAGFELAKLFLTKGTQDVRVMQPLETERDLAVKVFLQRSRERTLSLCDAISYAVVSTRLDWAPCLSFDADFAALGLTIFR